METETGNTEGLGGDGGADHTRPPAAAMAAIRDEEPPKQKRKRGRPRGSKNKPKSAEDVAQPKRKRGRPARSKNKPKRSLKVEMYSQDGPIVSFSAATDSAEGSAAGNTPTPQLSNAAAPTVTSPPSSIPPTTPQSAPSRPPPVQPATPHSTPSHRPPTLPTTPQSTPSRPPTIPSLYLNTLAAYSPTKEGWITRKKKYTGVGNAYIVGWVCRIVKRSLFQVNWLDSQFQNCVETLTMSTIQRGHVNHRTLHGNTSGIGWGMLCGVDDGEQVEIDDAFDELEECAEHFDPPTEHPTTLAEVEAITNMRFDPDSQSTAPTDMYEHDDNTTETRLRPELKHLFEHSASSSFFAYIPVSSWQQAVGETNTYARIHGIPVTPSFSLDEIMTFFGVLFYMALVDKGEYSNYWGEQVEDKLFGGSGVGLDSTMTLRRFKLLRQAFCFRCIEANGGNGDQAARIRPLLNRFKSTGSKYVELVRNVALDEASIACRSKYGKPLIVYNPMKPTGKYHFRIYMLCCSTTWISFNFRMHCQSDLTDRLTGVTTPEEAVALREELEVTSAIRNCVLEVTRPLHGTRRVVNSDNYYTSVQLIQASRLKGLYARGTVRKTSAHFPKHVLIDKKTSTRGESRQAVSAGYNMVAASWFDTSVVAVISIADPSTITTVARQIRSEKRDFTAPACIKAYNANMQGVDRLDQIRGRFSVADGHSFKKWHKKLALALIDVGRANAYLTRKLALGSSNARDPHRDFIVQLISELLTGQWKAAPGERRMFYADASLPADASHEMTPSSVVWLAGGRDGVASSTGPVKRCSAVASKQCFKDANRKRRKCIVCRWEDRYATEVTDFCVLHNACLCQSVFVSTKPYTCMETTWTFWEKYHRYYLPQKLFSSRGNVRSSCKLYKIEAADQESTGRGDEDQAATAGSSNADSAGLGGNTPRNVVRSIILT